jgi:hypothetical protein
VIASICARLARPLASSAAAEKTHRHRLETCGQHAIRSGVGRRMRRDCKHAFSAMHSGASGGVVRGRSWPRYRSRLK